MVLPNQTKLMILLETIDKTLRLWYNPNNDGLASIGGSISEMAQSVKEKEARIFRLDDSAEPGLAIVTVLQQTRVVAGRRCWRVRIEKILRPSFASYRVGQMVEAAESLLDSVS